MRKLLPLLTLVLSPCLLSAQNISFLFQGNGIPANNSVWTNTTISIYGQVYAPAQITAVTATVGGRQLRLSGTATTYTGNISLAGMPGDTLTLVIAARDTLNNTGDTAFTFIYRPLNDPAVSLTVDSLVDSSAVKSAFPLHARSAGNTIQVYNVNNGSEQLIATAADSLPVLDLSAYNGKKITLKVIATDSEGRTARQQLTAFVESSPYLTEYLTAQGAILDFRYNKALVADKASGYPVLIDAATGQRSATLVNYPVKDNQGFVTPEGAIFVAGPLYEWKNGQIVFQSGGDGLKVAGNYAAWEQNSGQLVRRNVLTGITDTINVPEPYNDFLDIADNGMLVFETASGRYVHSIYKYDSGQVSRVSPAGGGVFFQPVTDGHNAVYAYEEPYYPLYFYNGKSQVTAQLGNPGAEELPVAAYDDYQLNNGYTAFIREGQVIVRDTAGSQRQVTNFNYCSICMDRGMIDRLNAKGELMVSASDSGRYFINSSGQALRITTMPARADRFNRWSRSFYDGGHWYVLIGKTLFRVNIDSVVTVPQPVVTGLQSSYCNTADSQRLKIANLPLTTTGIQVAVLLDSTTVLPVMADSTFTIHPAVLSPGSHDLSITYSYDSIRQRLPLSFTITPAVTPTLDITVNVNPITTDTIPVIITASNVSGAGKQPLYTFAWDSHFINQLQLESNQPSVTVAAAQFELGDNVVYARVRTSDQCYTTQTGIDSIVINKTNITAIVDIDNHGKPIVVYPNPFRGQISVNGLQPVKAYIISLYDIQGKLLLQKRVVSQTKTEINPPESYGGIYILRVYDEKARKLLGTQKLVGY